MNVLQIHEPGPFIRYLREDPDELDRLFAELLISVTSFFRDPEAFDTLAAQALPDLLRSHRDEETLRAWVPGCATGEEAYSVAMVLVESMEKVQKIPKIQIFATDLDAGAIETARQGVYSEGIAADVSRERLERFFIKEGSLYRFAGPARDARIRAAQRHQGSALHQARPHRLPQPADLSRRGVAAVGAADVSSRVELKGRAAALGSSETVGSCHDLFETLDAKWKLYKKLPTAAQTLPVMARPTGLAQLGARGAEARPHAIARDNRQAAQIQKLLLSRFAPLSVVVDEHGTIVYITAGRELYMEPAEGTAAQQHRGHGPRGIEAGAAGSLGQALREKTEIVRSAVRVKTNGATSRRA